MPFGFTTDEIIENSRETERAKALLKAFRNVDEHDWRHLAMWIPESGHGRFWKSVFAEARAALTDTE
jgi:hypothetical protein